MLPNKIHHHTTKDTAVMDAGVDAADVTKEAETILHKIKTMDTIRLLSINNGRHFSIPCHLVSKANHMGNKHTKLSPSNIRICAIITQGQ